MKLVTVEQMRELDRRTIEEAGVPGDELMDRAGRGVAEVVRRLAEVSGFLQPAIQLLAGRGNNGGDAFAAARHLKEMGFEVEVWLVATANQVKGDALKHLSRMKGEGVKIKTLPTMEDWEEENRYPATGDILVDGLLGTGTSGPPRGPIVGAIQYINAHSRDALVVAIDIPSGLDADRGIAEGDAVRADLTVTMGLPKKGLVEPSALECVGSIEVVDIGIPSEFVAETGDDSGTALIYTTDLKDLIPRRPRDSHKGHYGHVIAIGGAKGYTGAITMAVKACLRAGAGLVSAIVPESTAMTVAGCTLEAMVEGSAETAEGSLTEAAWDAVRDRIDTYTALLVGPGLTRGPQSLQLVRRILAECKLPLVLDADALSVLEAHPEWIAEAHGPVIITPHPGELARLTGQPVMDIQSNRINSAIEAAGRTQATVVLKGAGTVVAEKDRPAAINVTGNPGMATGGSGDILAGMMAGLLCQGLATWDAARIAVYLHGRAGDYAAWRKSQTGLVAGDIIDEIPYVFRELTLR